MRKALLALIAVSAAAFAMAPSTQTLAAGASLPRPAADASSTLVTRVGGYYHHHRRRCCAPRYYYPRRVVRYAPVYYAAPARVYYAPPVVYYPPPVVYYPPPVVYRAYAPVYAPPESVYRAYAPRYYDSYHYSGYSGW